MLRSFSTCKSLWLLIPHFEFQFAILYLRFNVTIILIPTTYIACFPCIITGSILILFFFICSSLVSLVISDQLLSWFSSFLFFTGFFSLLVLKDYLKHRITFLAFSKGFYRGHIVANTFDSIDTLVPSDLVSIAKF